MRDLAHLKGQVAAIATLMAAGVMVLILAVTTLDSLRLSQSRFYQTHAFAQVFADLTRAPQEVAGRIAELAGVDQVETRIKAEVRLAVAGFQEPVRGLLISIPDGRQPRLNRLHLRAGSLPDPERLDQVLISEPFAQAHGLVAGDRLEAIIQGRYQRLSISGVALSPEHIYQVGPADLLPDYARYAVLWMNRRALEQALDMDGAFNSLTLSLQSGATPHGIIAAIDQALERYGGVGAIDREDQVSHRFLSEELAQLRVMAIVLPTLFLAVAAFLLSLLMGRIIQTQRQQIAILKAFGYADAHILLHFALLTALIVLLGASLGVALGVWAAEAMAGVYAQYYRFPELSFRLQPRVVVLGFLVAAGAAALGTWRATLQAARLAPAEAMRPPVPGRFRPFLLETSWLGRCLDQPTRIILRNLWRHRLKSLFSILGIALSGGLLLLGSYQFNAVDHLLDIQYRLVMASDLHLSFYDPTSERALAELRSLPGVTHVEGYRQVPVRLINGHLDYRTQIQGLEPEPRLRRLLDSAGEPIGLPPEGLLVTRYLANRLQLAPGDSLQIEIMEGHRRTLPVALAATVDEPIGVSAYMERRQLNRLMGEGPALSGVWLLSEPSERDALFKRLWDIPRIAGIGVTADAERQFRDYIDDTVLIMMGILLLMAGSITFAVVYNNARIAFSERTRELATLRVLGFTQGEVSWILIGELMLSALLAIPLGWAIGTGFALLLHQALAMDLFRMPFLITPRAYAFSAAGVLSASLLSVLAIARRLRELDLIEALKTVE